MFRNLSLFVLMLPWFLVPATVHGQTNDNENYGLNRIADLMETNTEAFCKLVTCFDPVEKEECPDGTFFMEGIAQFGCCGACVEFRGIGEQCTGSIHPKYCGGYGLYNPVSGCKDPWQNLRDLRDSISDDFYSQDNVVTSSWCGYNIACGNSRVCEINPEERGCVYIQNKYDEARAAGPDVYLDYRDDYRWRPTCTTDGFFAEKQCKGPRGEQRCVCVDPDGNRLFGEAFYYQEELFNSMNCSE
ncbi:uncharacterized protein LOC122249908 [Penaeus japonicus]|uniref:uncharacterized protein LOC122249908 n=1 Tax=Penaeus japonicus TaxID=27405 RepID=UPI001C70F9E5|nr:uncharacterized protein LOC122249908 [Penaeus japonicus]